ncbi:MAG: phenylalanine--tRNA ligase subunit alpha, partial [Chloroflexota bacterium]|nr:phenylalanine--tRNA ligase subunit alpha [Chloroflexota bacterium]
MLDELDRLRIESLEQLTHIWDDGALEEWRVKYLGRKGAISSAMEQLGTL